MSRPYYYMGNHLALTQLSTGQPFYVHTRDRGITPWIVLGGTWEHFVDPILCALAQPGDLCIDVGANMGYYTIKLAANVGPDGFVIALEPNPELFDVLATNVLINGYSGRIRAIHAAAGTQAGQSVLHVEDSNMGGGSIDPPWTLANGRTIDIAVVRVDDVTPDDRAAAVIKVDAEGQEVPTFRGMHRLLARSPAAAIVTEVSFDHWKRFGRPSDLLIEIAGGRDIFLITDAPHLLPLPSDQIERLLPHSIVGYVLLLPPNDPRRGRLTRFLNPIIEPEPAPSSESDAQPKPEPIFVASPEPVPHTPPTRRTWRRLAGLLAGRPNPAPAIALAPPMPEPPQPAGSVAVKRPAYEFRSEACRAEHFGRPSHALWSERFREPVTLRRKQWEWVYVAQALFERKMLQAGRSGLGFAVGREPLAAAFAAFGTKILATDLPSTATAATAWSATDQHAASIATLNELQLCEPEDFDRLVRFQELDMRQIPSNPNGFDFCWSAGSLEHLGSFAESERFLHTSLACLAPGGVAVHTTELNVSDRDNTIDSGDTVLFRPSDLTAIAGRLRAAGHDVEPLDFSLGQEPADRYIDLPPYQDAPHLKLLVGRFVITSFGLIIRKAS